jgi:hypothetical protein
VPVVVEEPTEEITAAAMAVATEIPVAAITVVVITAAEDRKAVADSLRNGISLLVYPFTGLFVDLFTGKKIFLGIRIFWCFFIWVIRELIIVRSATYKPTT